MKDTKIVLKDRFKSCITEDEIRKYKQQSKSSNPNHFNGRLTESSADELVAKGAAQMKKDGFKIASERTRDL